MNVALMKSMYIDQNMSTREVGDHFGVSHTCVRRNLKKAEVNLRSNAPKKVHDIERVIDLYVNKGLTSKQIGNKFHCCDHTILDVLRGADIHIKTKEEYIKSGADSPLYRGGSIHNPNASYLAHKAIRDGFLIRPSNCESCDRLVGKRKNGRAALEAHHDDYNKPLEVKFLCRSCHVQWHQHNLAIERIPS